MSTQLIRERKNLIINLSFDFALDIVKFCEQLHKIRKYELSKQLFRSGTSIGANIMEAQNAESKKDFLHKLKIAAKEANETAFWLMLCYESENYPNPENLLPQLESIQKVINKIISSTKKSMT